MRTWRPLDIETIVASVKKTGACVVADQSWPFASVGSEVTAQIHERCFDDLDGPVKRVHNDDMPAPYNRQREQDMLPNARKIAEAVKAALYRA